VHARVRVCIIGSKNDVTFVHALAQILGLSEGVTSTKAAMDPEGARLLAYSSIMPIGSLPATCV